MTLHGLLSFQIVLFNADGSLAVLEFRRATTGSYSSAHSALADLCWRMSYPFTVAAEPLQSRMR